MNPLIKNTARLVACAFLLNILADTAQTAPFNDTLRPLAIVDSARPGLEQKSPLRKIKAATADLDSALTLELTKEGIWRQLVLTRKQYEIITGVFKDLRAVHTADRNEPLYRGLNMNSMLRRFRAGGEQLGVDICCIPDEIFYRNVRYRSEQEGVKFPANWLLVGLPLVKKSASGKIIRVEIGITDTAGEILSQMKEEKGEKGFYIEFLKRQLSYLDFMVSGIVGDAPAAHGFLSEFIDEFDDQFDPPEARPLVSAELPELWPHQKEALEKLRVLYAGGKKRALLCHATGAGKTRSAAQGAREFIGNSEGNVLYLVHLAGVRQDMLSTFEKFWLPGLPRPPAVFFGQTSVQKALRDHQVLLMSCQYMERHLGDFPPGAFKYIIIDEAHRAATPTYQAIMRHFTPDFSLGLTGTSQRTDGVDVSILFDNNVADRRDVTDLVELDILPPVKIYRVETNIEVELERKGEDFDRPTLRKYIDVPERNRLVVKTYKDMLGSKEYGIKKDAPAICFCVSRRHAERMARAFEAAGIKAQAVDSRTRPRQLRKYKQMYRRGKIQVLVACDVLNEAVDLPETEVILMARPTLSRVLYLQQMGRGLRKHPGKEALWLVDFVDNTVNIQQRPLALHSVLDIPDYFPGQIAIGPRRQKALQLEDLKRKGIHRAVVKPIPTPISLSELADMLGLSPYDILYVMEHNISETDRKRLFREVEVRRQRDVKKVIYTDLGFVEEIREIMERCRQEHIKWLNAETDRKSVLDDLRDDDETGFETALCTLARLRTGIEVEYRLWTTRSSHNPMLSVYYRDEQVLLEIIRWLWRGDPGIRNVTIGDENCRTTHGIEAAEILLNRVHGLPVINLLKKALNDERGLFRRAYCAAILELKDVPADEYRDFLKRGLKERDFQLAYLCARALLHADRRHSPGKESRAEKMVNKELMDTLLANHEIGKYDRQLYFKANYLIMALAEHYYTCDEPEVLERKANREKDNQMNFLLNYALELKRRQGYMYSQNPPPEDEKWAKIAHPWTFIEAAKRFLNTDYRFDDKPEALIHEDFDAIAERIVEDLDAVIYEFCEYAKDFDDAEGILREEIEKGRNRDLWKELDVTYQRDEVSPVIMLERFRELREQAYAGKLRYPIYFKEDDRHVYEFQPPAPAGLPQQQSDPALSSV